MDRALLSIIEWWGSAGVDVPEIKPLAPRKRAVPERQAVPGNTAPQKAAPRTAPEAAPTPQSAEVAKSAKTLDALKTVMSGFNAGEISDHARQMVFARGNPDADIMVIGEAPGLDDDIAGKPFAGKTGQFFDKIFASIGLDEETLYITYVVNWHPPKDRNPTAEEIALCKPFLERHIELVDPKLIVLVGGISMTAMTDMTGIMKNRGQWTSLTIGGKDIPALPIYHPAFLLKQPAVKKDCWRDMLSLRERHAAL